VGRTYRGEVARSSRQSHQSKEELRPTADWKVIGPKRSNHHQGKKSFSTCERNEERTSRKKTATKKDRMSTSPNTVNHRGSYNASCAKKRGEECSSNARETYSQGGGNREKAFLPERKEERTTNWRKSENQPLSLETGRGGSHQLV